MSKWKNVHEEYLGRSNISLAIFVSDDDYGDDPKTLFEVNENGLEITYYTEAKEAVEGGIYVGFLCYGYVSILVESGKIDELLDKIWDEQHDEKVTVCDHEGSCADQFIKAQKVLGNE